MVVKTPFSFLLDSLLRSNHHLTRQLFNTSIHYHTQTNKATAKDSRLRCRSLTRDSLDTEGPRHQSRRQRHSNSFSIMIKVSESLQCGIQSRTAFFFSLHGFWVASLPANLVASMCCFLGSFRESNWALMLTQSLFSHSCP